MSENKVVDTPAPVVEDPTVGRIQVRFIRQLLWLEALS